jgi:hypothetical protein
MALVTFGLSSAPLYVFGIDAAFEPARFDTVLKYNVYAVALVGALLGGWLCRKIARSRMAVVPLAVLGFAGGMANGYAQHMKPVPGVRTAGISVADAVARRKEPSWFTLLVPCLGTAGILVAGLSSRDNTERRPASEAGR